MSSRLIEKSKRISSSIIKINLDPVVETTESFYPKFSLSAFFADLGGSLGLWLGLGAVQILSNGIGLAMWLKPSFGKPFTHK